MNVRKSFFALLSLLLVQNCGLADLRLSLAPQADIESKLQAGLVPLGKRQEVIQKLFTEVGCQATLQQVDRKNSNVICSLPGETDATIIVGGHLDFIESGKGIIDDWSGTALLPSLYAVLKTETRHHGFRFVAFAKEETGMVGSTKYVNLSTKEELARVTAFVNLECLGLGLPKVWVHRSDPVLVRRLAEISKATNIPISGVDVEQIGDDDTHPFLSKKVPVVSIHSVTQESLGILHSRQDDLSAVRQKDYYDTYRFVAFYLAYLDQTLGTDH